MKKKFIVAAVAATTFGLAAAGTASAEKPADPGAGGRCAKAGTAELRSGRLPVSLVDVAQDGLGDFPTLGAVVKAHTQTPSAFPWCS